MLWTCQSASIHTASGPLCCLDYWWSRGLPIVSQEARECLFCMQPPPEGGKKVAKVLLSERGPVHMPDLGVPPYALEVIHL